MGCGPAERPVWDAASTQAPMTIHVRTSGPMIRDTLVVQDIQLIANVRTYRFGLRPANGLTANSNDIMVMVVWGNVGRTGLSNTTSGILWASRRSKDPRP